MDRIIIQARVKGDGSLRLDLPAGTAKAHTDVQVTIEPLFGADKRPLLASDLLQSELIGMWAQRSDIGDNHEFARRLRQQAQTRGRAS
jgi:hypothetical protein